MKEKWFDYIVANKKLWCNGFTLKRLERVKTSVLNDTPIACDLIRHGANKTSPEDMKTANPVIYNHCIDNFACNILYKMLSEKIIPANK